MMSGMRCVSYADLRPFLRRPFFGFLAARRLPEADYQRYRRSFPASCASFYTESSFIE